MNAAILVDTRVPARSGRREALRCHALRRHLALQAVGQSADATALVTIAAVLVLRTTQWHSVAELVMGLLLAVMPAVLSLPLAWRIADTECRVRRLSTVHAVRAVIAAAAAVVLVVPNRTLGLAICGVMAAAQAVTGSLRAAALPSTVPPSRIAAASSLAVLTGKASGVLGIGLAASTGFVAVWIPFVVAASLHVAASVGYARWRHEHGDRSSGERPVAAPPSLVSSPQVLMVVGLRGITGAATMLFAVLADRRLGLGDRGYALAIGASSAGMLLGAFLGPVWYRHRGTSPVAHLLPAAAVLTVLLGSVVSGVTTSALVIVGLAAVSAAARLEADAVVLREVEDRRGRSFAVYDASFQVAFVAGACLAATNPAPPRLTFQLLALGLALLLAASWHMSSRATKQVTGSAGHPQQRST
ncbi:MAG: hypothetical protein ACOYMR_07830 [Ilumatobacteraceae bacterium]